MLIHFEENILMKMDEQVKYDENVYDIPMECENTSIHEYSTLTKVWNDKHAEMCKSSRIRDRIMIAVIVMQIICLSVAITSIIMHFNGKHVLILNLNSFFETQSCQNTKPQ